MWRKKAAVATEPVSVVKQINIGQNAISYNVDCGGCWLHAPSALLPSALYPTVYY